MSAVPAPLAAALLPRYRLERELGADGMAIVYLAHDVRHDREVAIKVLNRELAAVVGPDRFIAEIRTTAHFRHPHILPLFDSGSADGLPYYVMPFVDGESLRQRLSRAVRPPVSEAVAMLRELADALAYAHAAGVIHRDVKPDNVLLAGRHVFLADFGVARAVAAHVTRDQTVTGTSMMVGTPAYMAPEQLTGDPVDARTDVYAFGVLAYELLTGAPPFRGGSSFACLVSGRATHRLRQPSSRLHVRRREPGQRRDEQFVCGERPDPSDHARDQRRLAGRQPGVDARWAIDPLHFKPRRWPGRVPAAPRSQRGA